MSNERGGKKERKYRRACAKQVKEAVSKLRLELRNQPEDITYQKAARLRTTCQKYGWSVRISPNGKRVILKGL